MTVSRFLPQKALSPTALTALLSLYFTGVLSYPFYRAVLSVNPFQGRPEDYFIFTLPIIIFCILNALFQLTALPFVHKILMPFLLVAGAAISYQEIFFGIYFNSDQLVNVLQTGFTESSKLMTLPYIAWIAVFGILPAWLYARTPVRYRRWYKEIGIRLATVAVSLAVVASVAKFYYKDYASFFRNHKETVNEDNLLDILQRAGIEILWRDNDSGCKGVCRRVPSQDMTALNLKEYCKNGECLDEILLKDLDKELTKTDKDTVIVLHTIGSHGPTYNERYTKAFEQFKPVCDTHEIHRCSNEQLVNTYDNGILYIDNLLNEIIGHLEKHPEWESTLLYVSDHGESLGEDGVYLHAAPYAIAPVYQTSVPMVMWFSEAWKKNEGFDLACLRRNAETQQYSHDNYFHTVFSMMDINAGEIESYDKNMDILAQCHLNKPET